MYKIFEYFPIEARQRVAGMKFEMVDDPSCPSTRVNDEDMCPLGAIMNEIGFKGVKAPTASCIAGVMIYNGMIYDEQEEDVFRDASEFIDMWDSNCVVDLEVALGLKS